MRNDDDRFLLLPQRLYRQLNVLLGVGNGQVLPA
ncbi:hypothetical protein HNQ92_003888 [Rhabdobacter roseus]|uniref:Uncharacterized protein n=1 Tax=Rhabdobacter roseus TaxID=1655419 RepID=A0A840TZY7_9BACT|nr:hypothetical protein [Rhabdobacter roseus]